MPQKMHIYYLLKEEDRRIPTTKGRSLDFEKISIRYTNQLALALFINYQHSRM